MTKLSPDGTALAYSTYLGGSGNENSFFGFRSGIVVDAGGSAYVAALCRA